MSKHQIKPEYLVWSMSRPTRDGTAETVSRDQILRRERGQENINFPCSADHEQDWQPYPVDSSCSGSCDGHTYIHTTRYVSEGPLVIPEKEGPITTTRTIIRTTGFVSADSRQ